MHAVVANKVKTQQLNDRVRAVLKLVDQAMKSGVPTNASEHVLNRPEDQQLLRRVAAESIVLLKNENSILPFKKDERIAVIGPNAKITTYCGGGSASLNPYYTITPYEGIASKSTADVSFSQGAYGHQSLPTIGPLLSTIEGKKGFTLKVYNEPPTAYKRQLLEERLLTDSMIFFLDYAHPSLNPIWYADAEGIFVPCESGVYEFGLCLQGTGRLYIDDELIVTNVENQRSGPAFLGSGTLEEVGCKTLVAGTAYRILVQWGSAKTSALKPPGVVDFGHGGFRFSGCKRLDPQEAIEAATELAKEVDQVVIFTGLSGEWETEGQDRENMDLPPGTNELVTRVLEANPNTVIVVQSGTPVAMPWIDDAKAVVHAWYGGNETGNGIANVLYGDVNPVSTFYELMAANVLIIFKCGKLPLTIPRRIEDNPAYLNYRSEGGRVLYGEDVYVGYRYYDKINLLTLFPFGHGLSYTTFSLSSPSIKFQTASAISLSVDIKNAGSISGSEVIQVYIAHVKPRINRPKKELKGFKKVSLKSGEEREVSIELEVKNATSFWDEYNGKWCSEKGRYRVLVGNSSVGEFVETAFELKDDSYWLGLGS